MTNSSFLVVEHSLFMGQSSTWTRSQRSVSWQTRSKCATTVYNNMNDLQDFNFQMVPDIKSGARTRIALDVGCGVASFGAYLFGQNVTTLSVAPKDVHENQIQFALERGVPAMLGVFATHRLLYPSQAFELIHCSRCRVNWTRDGTFIPICLFLEPSFNNK